MTTVLERARCSLAAFDEAMSSVRSELEKLREIESGSQQAVSEFVLPDMKARQQLATSSFHDLVEIDNELIASAEHTTPHGLHLLQEALKFVLLVLNELGRLRQELLSNHTSFLASLSKVKDSIDLKARDGVELLARDYIAWIQDNLAWAQTLEQKAQAHRDRLEQVLEPLTREARSRVIARALGRLERWRYEPASALGFVVGGIVGVGFLAFGLSPFLGFAIGFVPTFVATVEAIRVSS